MRTRIGVIVVCAAGAVLVAAQRPERRPVQQPCPRATLWSNVRDSLWPRFAHVDGDDRWAHRDTTGLPARTATWCNPLAADAQALNAGRSLYQQNECHTCHGDGGAGDGPGAGVSDPPPYAFTRPEFAGMREPPGPAVLYAIITRGIAGTAMQAHGAQLSGWERLALISYLTSLPGPEAARAGRAWADTLDARAAARP